ncbi:MULTISPECIES: sensor histidine kinase [Bacillaceae]|uniref:sensor histidine kinase n=1 Tax=Bacillaceae TaxID=186817 RepID=UPI001E383BCD|nr:MULTISPECIES: sensor histidine kinase [Bacillaceae]UGB31246.1 sensor histidine kinase [Metabacillus sp. B2-18]
MKVQFTLQTKILGLIFFLILLVIGVLTATFAFNETKEDVKQAEELALQTAQTLSFMPAVQEGFREQNANRQSMNLVITKMMNQVDATSIFVENREKKIIAGEKPISESHETYKALVFGSSYVTHVGKEEEEVLRGIAPIILNHGDYTKVEGAVVVEFQMLEIRDRISGEVKGMVMTSAIVLIIGVIGSIVLARNIRKDTLGLEPYEIALLFRERNAILQSVKEGIIAIDQYGRVTMMNKSAQQILDISSRDEVQRINEMISSDTILKLMESKKDVVNEEVQYKDRTLIVNTQPVLEDGERVGTVATFRDKTEMKKMVDAFSEVKQYSEDLRAQAHEFTNKLYVILGLIQLGKKEEAIQLIQEETKSQEHHGELIFNSIQDEKIQAILLGKLAKASEKKIVFHIDEESSLSPLSEKFKLAPLIIILGNILDNAFDAAADSKEKKVSFFATDFGNDVLFEITDSGKGIPDGMEEAIFDKGVSLKGEKRGYGLANVKEEVELLGGFIELTSTEDEGTVFSVFLPKE